MQGRSLHNGKYDEDGGKKIFQNTDQKVKVKLDGRASVHLMATSIYRRTNPQLFDNDGALQLEKFDKDWTNLVTYEVALSNRLV